MIPIKIGLGISSAWLGKRLLFFETLLTNLGGFLFGRNSTATLIDQQPLLKSAKINEARFEGVRRVENLFSLPELPATQIVNLPAGDYAMQLWADGSSADVTLTGQAAGTLAVTTTEHKALSFSVATGGNVTFTLTGTLEKFMLENVTGQTNQNPSEFTLKQWQGELNFDGIDDYIDCGGSAVLKGLANSSFSLSAWINPALDGSEDAFFGNAPGTSGYHIRVTSSNNVRFGIITDGSKFRFSDTLVLNPGWSHIIGTWDGIDVTTYVNGVEETTHIYNGTLAALTSNFNLYIGNVPGSNAQNTVCPKCKKIVIERKGYRILQNNIVNGKCKNCNTPIAGVWN